MWSQRLNYLATRVSTGRMRASSVARELAHARGEELAMDPVREWWQETMPIIKALLVAGLLAIDVQGTDEVPVSEVAAHIKDTTDKPGAGSPAIPAPMSRLVWRWANR